MRVVLAVDAIASPLTGIGRYTWELANFYRSASSGLDEARFYLPGRVLDDPTELLAQLGVPSARKRKSWLPKLPRSLQRLHMRRQLNRGLFHGPNYFLPDLVECGCVTVHDLSVFRFPETHPVERIRHFEEKFQSTLARANCLITDSEFIRQEVMTYFGWPSERIVQIGLGVSPEFRPRDSHALGMISTEYGLVPGGYALCVSTLEPRKRIDGLLCAYRLLPDELRVRFPLVLVGGKGWLSENLHRQIEAGQREGWLKYLGFVPQADLPAIYAGAHAFLYPSIYEGFGLPVLEALASGVPTLTSRSSSLQEITHEAAYLVDPEADEVGMAAAIEQVIVDDDWRRQAKQRGLEVAGLYTWERCARRTIELYETIGR